MDLMAEKRCAEDVKKAVEGIVNNYNFDKSKVNGNAVIF